MWLVHMRGLHGCVYIFLHEEGQACMYVCIDYQQARPKSTALSLKERPGPLPVPFP